MTTDRSNSSALIGGVLLIVFGLLALFGQLFRDVLNWGILWPFTVIGFGALFFVGMFAGGRQVSGLAIPGTIIGGIGLLLLYQNLSHHWESWAYGWTLIVIFVGAGIFFMGLYEGSSGRKTAGLRVMRTGLFLFVIFGAFFEMLFVGTGPLNVRTVIFPILLVVLGGYLVLTRLGLLKTGGGGDGNQSLPPT